MIRPLRHLPFVLTLVAIGAYPPTVDASDEAEESARATPSRRDIAAMLSSFEGEPSVRDVQRAALEHAGLDASAPKTWAGRARLANLIPDLDGEIAWLDQRDIERRYREEIESVESGTLHPDSADSRYQNDERFRTIYSIEAELELGGLVFDSDEVYAAREIRQQQTARRKLVAAVTDLYFERRKKQVLRLATPPRQWRKRLDLVLAIERLSARIDGLTGGWFRRHLESNRPDKNGDDHAETIRSP